MKVLRVVTLGSRKGLYGGPYDTACRQSEIMSRAGWTVTVLAGSFHDDKPRPPGNTTVRHLNPVVRKLAPIKGFVSVGSLKMARAVISETRRTDVVHISISRELVPMFSLIVALLLRKPVCVQPHGMLTSRNSVAHSLLDILVKLMLTKSSRIISLTSTESTQLVERFGKQLKSRITELGNPIPEDVRSHLRIAPERLEALFIARLHPRKKVNVFTDAASFSSMSGWEESYVVFGPDEGDLGIVMKAQEGLSTLAYGGAVSSAEVTRLVSEAGVFVLTSRDEPWGNVLATALASGVPVVVSRSAALSSLVELYGCGAVVEDNDYKGYARAIHELLGDNYAYAKASAAALELAHDKINNSAIRHTLERMFIRALDGRSL